MREVNATQLRSYIAECVVEFSMRLFFFFQAEDGIRDYKVTGVQTCALPICGGDIKMMAMIGSFLGWQGVLLTLFLGAVFGTIIFLPLKLAGRDKLVPFGIDRKSVV